MIPVLAVPVLDRYDLLDGMEESVDADVGRYYIIDNGGRYDHRRPWVGERHVCQPGANLGFAASLNLAIKANIMAPWWFFVNDDVRFAPGDMELMAEAMESTDQPQIAILGECHFSAFGVNEAAIERVGWFDESYHPAYCEDCDWQWRARLAGDVHFIYVPGKSRHLGSQTIGGSHARRTSNDRTYPLNKEYHFAKWGGEPHAESHISPFDAGGDISVTVAPRLSRLRELAW